MDLKAEENKRVAKKCKDIGCFNAGATRAYYSAFQRAKSYLEKNGFDYAAFLISIGADTSERAFSHGTIQRAVVECMMRQGKSRADIYKLNIWDNLYNKRRLFSLNEVNLLYS